MASIDVRQRYADKLKSVYREADDVNKVLDIISTPMQDTVNIIDQLLEADSYLTKSGDNLDKEASKTGVKRPYEQEPSEHLFTLADEGEVDNGDFYTGFGDENDPDIGGYLADETGLPLVSDPNKKMNDEDFRFLIQQKAASFRKKARELNLFNYVSAFGGRAFVNDKALLDIEFDLLDYHSLNDFEKWYVIKKGFKPAGVGTGFRENVRDGDAI